MRFRAIVILAALCLSTQTAGTPQDPARPQFRTGVEVRRLDVVVVDRDGRPVRGLTAADFTILEDGKPQKISTIEEIAIPEAETVHADWMRDVASDVRTNDMPVDGRLMVIVIDDAMSRDPQLTVEDHRLESDFLETMSANTGGFAIVNTNAPEARVPEIFTATSAYYLIGYEVQKQDDGRFRRLEVKVSRPGLTVHARKGYVAPRPNSPAKAEKPEAGMSPLATAMAGFLPKGDVPMQVTALPFALPGRSEAGGVSRCFSTCSV